MTTFIALFSDPVLRAPFIASSIMGIAMALVGVIVNLRRRSLLGETLAHATYPGVGLGVVFAALFFPNHWIAPFILAGALLSALLGLWCVNFLVSRLKVSQDSALCFVLAAFFGMGITLASRLQFTHTVAYQKIQMYLFGQAATMTDIQIWLYTALLLLVALVIFSFYKEIQAVSFDVNFCLSIHMSVALVDRICFTLIVLAVIMGLRTVGIVLVSAMLIAPPVAARQYTDRLGWIFALSGLFGALSGFLGNYSSMLAGEILSIYFPKAYVSLPTGPMIVLAAALICVLSLFFAPKKGFFIRYVRALKFRHRCLQENILKAMWRRETPYQKKELKVLLKVFFPYFILVLRGLAQQGWIQSEKQGVYLTSDGRRKAARIVRLHRLWEVYLVDYLGMGAERVHPVAEEMEHIITPSIEKQLIDLMGDPSEDPHHQPIPVEGAE